MLMQDVVGRAIVAIIGATNVLILLPLTAVMFHDYWHFRGTGDRNQFRRLALALFVLAMQFFLCWALFIWLDIALWDGKVLGPTVGRWRIDIGVRTILLVLTVPLAVVFWRDRLLSSDQGQSAAQQAQTDRMEAMGADTNRRLRAGDIGHANEAIVQRAQADRIEVTGEATHKIVSHDSEEQT